MNGYYLFAAVCGVVCMYISYLNNNRYIAMCLYGIATGIALYMGVTS